MKNGITLNDFTAEAQIWFSIICSRFSPSTNLTNVMVMCAQIVASLLDYIPLNVCHFVILDIQYYNKKRPNSHIPILDCGVVQEGGG